ncbi:hypothetical protein TRAPUB_6592 [Trametes pubescens]|uniref:DUF6535 domain-containing protein n=1 Tax=Trametes pubescens TaxID=154538 RepID=A0A1M2V5H3_TRAPU|nr:hypothetical protein TRAPUB_6592 [Trametes pubescens]
MYVKASDVYTQEQKTKAWSDAAEMVQTYSDETIKRWKEEIDTYLVFSYLLLQPSPPDPSIAVLEHISSQLASFSVNPPFVNSTQPPSTGGARTSTPPPVPYWAVWLNTLWFSGLILSLTSASIGIMVKQWLNEYGSGVSGTSRPASRMRQYRLNNLRSWHVEDVIVTIPILLQLALALFLAGLLILLWTLDDTVAAVASTLIGLLAVFTLTTIVLPLVNHKCSYLTPQIRAVNAIWQPKRFAYWLCSFISAWCRTISEFLDRTRVASHHSLSSFDPRIHRYLTRLVLQGTIPSFKTVFRRLEHAIKMPEVWAEHKQTWQGRERSAIDKLARGLDTQTLLEAYNSTLHPDALSAATVCLMDYRSEFVIDYFRQLHTAAREHFGAATDSEDGPLGYGNRQQLLWLYIIMCVLRQDNIPLSDDEAAALRVYFRCGSWSSGMQAADAGWAVSTCNAMFDHLETSGTSSQAHFIHKDDIQMEWELLIEAALRRKSHITEAPSDEAQEAHTRYLESVDDFLRCADRVLTSSLPASALETVRAYTRDTLVELTRTLLWLFAEDKVQTTIESTRLWSILYGSESVGVGVGYL